MLDLPPCILQNFVKLVPSSIVKDVTCFVFYDNHPCNDLKIDLIVCTSKGEIFELYEREILYESVVDTISQPKEICLHRNSKGDLYYLVTTSIELFIFSRTDTLVIVNKISNMERFALDDPACSGKIILQVWTNDDAVPLVFNENMERVTFLQDRSNDTEIEDNLPFVNMLKTKLTEAKYTVAQNEKALEDLLRLRQSVAFSTYCEMYPDLKESIFKESFKEALTGSEIKLSTPLLKQCNNKVVITFTMYNNSDNNIEDILVILHSSSENVLAYETKLYESITNQPFWKESLTKDIVRGSYKNIVVVFDKKELNFNICHIIQLMGIILYKIDGRDKILPIDDITQRHMDLMNKKFDILPSSHLDTNDILAILATSYKTELLMHHIHRDYERDIIICDVLCEYLKMEYVPNTTNVIIHKISPYHILNGVMVLIEGNGSNQSCFNITVFSRCISQVVSLVHYIYDAVPYRLLVTAPQTQITIKNKVLHKKIKPQNIPEQDDKKSNLLSYGESLTGQMTQILKFYDECITKMGASKNQDVLSKIGKEIDLLIEGSEKFQKFNKHLNTEILNGIDCLNGKGKIMINSDAMVVEDDD